MTSWAAEAGPSASVGVGACQAKEGLGKVTGDKSTEHEGQREQTKSHLKDAGEKVKEAGEKLKEAGEKVFHKK